MAKSKKGSTSKSPKKGKMKAIKNASINAGVVAGGMVAAHAVGMAVEKQTQHIAAPLAIGALAIVGSTFIKNPKFKQLAIAAGGYSVVRGLSKVVYSDDEPVEGLSGLNLPEGVKSAAAQFIPRLSGAGDGFAMESLRGTPGETIDTDFEDVTTATATEALL